MGDLQQPKKEVWAFRKDVSIGDLVAFCTALIAVMYSYSTLDTRVRLLEQSLPHVVNDNRRQDAERLNIRAEIRQELRDLNQKLDALIRDGKK